MSRVLTAPVVQEPGSPARQASSLPALTAAALAVAYALLFGWLSLRAYWGFEMHALDMGNMGQAAWNTIHGHPFAFTNMYPLYAIEAWGTTTRLSFHVEYLYPLIALVYLIYPHPESLLILQTIAIAAGALPIYLLARDLVGRWTAVILVAAYLLFPATEALNLYEFHPVALATPLLLFAFLFAYRRQYLLFALAALAAMGTKEQIGLIVAMLGLYIAAVNRDRIVGLASAAIAAGWSLIALLVVEHHFRTPGSKSYLHTRYGYLLGHNGHGLHAVLHTLSHNPLIIWQNLAGWPKADFLVHLLAPLGFLSIFGAPFLLLGAPSFAIDLLSDDPHMYSALGDNSAELISVAVVAAVFGAYVLVKMLRPYRLEWVPGVLLLAGMIWQQHVDGFTPLGPRFQTAPIGPHQMLQRRFVALVPAGAAVSTSDTLDPHLSSRRWLYLYPLLGTGATPGEGRLAPARDILLDVTSPVYPIPPDQQYSAAVQQIHHSGWGIVAARDGLILIARGAHAKHIPRAFYSFLHAGGRPPHAVSGAAHGLAVTGYSRAATDLANHRIPSYAYTIDLRPSRHVSNLQPVLYEMIDGRLHGCDPFPLGLSWLPTSRWTPGHTYAVRMQPFETQWNGPPRTIDMVLSLQPVRRETDPCTTFWSHRSRLWPVGTVWTGD
ncbi:MAG TPA: DUF2079 domain-containing protein [Chloroflexota bacterium]|nr:DUF2079 domain-containing protein [Chloroflexota bacterium]